jgi:hypothetical protein
MVGSPHTFEQGAWQDFLAAKKKKKNSMGYAAEESNPTTHCHLAFTPTQPCVSYLAPIFAVVFGPVLLSKFAFIHSSDE